jgi:predicted phosphodiesterase
MTTAVVSDLHLGGVSLPEMARLREPRERLAEAVAKADRVVILGDVLELRQRPIAQVLELARPFFERLGEAAAGREIVLVPGNHDYQLTEPWLSRAQLDGAELPLESRWPVTPDDGLAGRLARWMPAADLSVAYPGLWLRPDVYATHGHYLDLYLTVPRIESIVASVMGRVTSRADAASTPADYEAVLAPMYAWFHGVAQSASPDTLRRGGALSRTVWRRVNADDGRVGRFLLGRVTIPGAVAAMNRLGIGPFRAELTGPELRRAGLRAMSEVVERLGIEADHVLFGHTHRPGPMARDDEGEWRTPGGVRLWNSGCWLVDTAFVARDGTQNPYWPGTVIYVEDEGDPRVENALEGVSLPAPTRG